MPRIAPPLRASNSSTVVSGVMETLLTSFLHAHPVEDGPIRMPSNLFCGARSDEDDGGNEQGEDGFGRFIHDRAAVVTVSNIRGSW